MKREISITLNCSKDADLERLRLNLYHKDLRGKQYPQKPIITFTRYKNTERVDTIARRSRQSSGIFEDNTPVQE